MMTLRDSKYYKNPQKSLSVVRVVGLSFNISMNAIISCWRHNSTWNDDTRSMYFLARNRERISRSAEQTSHLHCSIMYGLPRNRSRFNENFSDENKLFCYMSWWKYNEERWKRFDVVSRRIYLFTVESLPMFSHLDLYPEEWVRYHSVNSHTKLNAANVLFSFLVCLSFRLESPMMLTFA